MKRAVLLLAHGSPDSVQEIPEFLLQITRGRPLAAEVIAEVQHRYGRIGCSPLTRLTLEQGRLLSENLGMPVYVGMRNWKPYIADAMVQMAADRIEQAVAICLAPQNSRTSVGLYGAALQLNGEPGFAIDFVESWHDHPLLIKAFAEKFTAGWSPGVPVIFTAHSVPQRTIAEGDPTSGRPRRPRGWWPGKWA